MRGFYLTVKVGFILLLLQSLIIVNVFSQSRTITKRPGVRIQPLVYGLYESLPATYNTTSNLYPVLIFLHGLGERGNGSVGDLDKLENNGVIKRIKAGTFPETFTVNSQTHSFIVIAPQYNGDVNSGQLGPYPGGETVNNTIDYVLANYRVDPSRIYVAGLSGGGAFTWYGAGMTINAAKRLAAIVTMAGAGTFPDWARNIGKANLPMWSFCNSGDDAFYVQVTNEWVQIVNETVPTPSPLAKKTIFNLPGHGSWEEATNPAYRENGKNIYEWMLTYQSGSVVLPVVLATYTATASPDAKKVLVTWTTTQEQNNSFFTIARSADGITFVPAGKLPAKTQGQGNSYTFTDPSPLEGTSYYRLSQTDLDGTTKSFDIKTVNLNTGNGADKVRTYPNPANDYLALEISHPVKGMLNVQILNTEGKIITTRLYSKPFRSFLQTIPIGGLKKGFYLLKITGDNYLSTQRFVKQ